MTTAVQVQYRRGTPSQIASFTGAQGEMAVDTTNNRVVVQDGATAGGLPAAKLIEVGRLSVSVSVNFNAANADTAIPITLPPGFTRYHIDAVFISGASASLTTATCGLFTATGGGGIAIVTGGSAVTVSSPSNDTNNNMQSFAINNQNSMSFSDATLYFRVGTAEGSAATGKVTVSYAPLP